MPKALPQSINGFRFFFYSNEGSPPEPAHVHVRHGEFEAKFWLGPPVEVASSDMPRHLEKQARLLVGQHRVTIESNWHEHLRSFDP